MDDAEIERAFAEKGIGLTAFEGRRIAELLGRDPTLVELYVFNSEWSEHCSYKSSRPVLREFLHSDAPNVILGPQEDAGIVFFTEHEGRRWGIVIAHESHNHPSQVLPYEGAATGIGGIIRDVDCMGARVVGTADPLRFGDLHGEHADRSKWIARGVVDGIWGYGNALGVPVLCGDVYFHESFDDNCLVNVVAVGVVAEDEIIHSAVPPQAHDEPYVLILVGKPTDDSGFGGSAFASKILSEEEQEEDRGAVQVPDAFLKNVLAMRKANHAVRDRARELGIVIGLKDIGGGGMACATSEICSAGGVGVEIDLQQVHQALPNLLPETVMCAETQERYVLAVPERFADEVLRIYNEDWDLPNVYEGAQAAVIGRVLPDEQVYRVRVGDTVVVEAPVKAVTEGIVYDRPAEPRQWTEQEPEFDQPDDLARTLLDVMAHPNVCSRVYIYRVYDTEVQGHAVLRPGEAGAGVIAPLEGSTAAMALAVGGNPLYGLISPYWGGATAVAEAMRNVAAVGAAPQAITDCLNYGNPEKPQAFWEFREGVRGLAEAARELTLKDYPGSPTPIISGNVSFYNESAEGRAVAPSPVIACVGTMPDFSKAITMGLKNAGDSLFLLGPRKDELGGSAYYQALGLGLGANVPQIDWQLERGMMFAVIDAIRDGVVVACQDISDGGMIVALAEMAVAALEARRLGAEIDVAPLASDLRLDKLLFSESTGFVLEVTQGREDELLAICARQGVEPLRLGYVTRVPHVMATLGDEPVLHASVADLAEAYRTALPRHFES
ncbi:MAG: phosphoribosylformylglycinamidine synthase subunit PurL [Armatimonadetes bacterium]|nr:phosphoribosylformylglycinamidine synthase subunit PurL [Armatimonadota bacterium]